MSNNTRLIKATERMVLVVNRYCPWLSASIPNEMFEYRYVDNGEINITRQNVIELLVKKDWYCYKRGRCYRVYFADIESAVLAVLKTDKTFSSRYELGCLTPDDVKNIIKRATSSLVRISFNNIDNI